MIADFHARAITQARGARLIGVASRNEASARELAGRHDAPFATGDLEALLARPDVQVVCVTTPSGAHLEPALAAIKAGKHVVIEKPIEITTARADTIIEAADRAGVHIVPIFQSRFGQGARTVKAALDAGRVGRLVLASAYVKWHRPASYYTGWKGTFALDGGGVVINQSIHGLDLLQWFAGLPSEVFAWTSRRVHCGIEAEDTASAALRYPHGALGTFEATTGAWPGWSRRIELCGENGSICLEDDRIVRWDFREEQPEDAAIRSAPPDEALRSGSGAAHAISHEGHQRQIQDLIDAIHGGRKPVVDGREARKSVALVNAIYASAAAGKPLQLS